MTITRFEDIEAWKLGCELTRAIYRISKTGEFARIYALRDQIRRAALSITSNIAEGFERGGNREFLQALSVAKGSAGEVRSQLYAALDEAYLTEVEFANLREQCLHLSRVIAGFMSFLQRAPIAGPKFRATKGVAREDPKRDPRAESSRRPRRNEGKPDALTRIDFIRFPRRSRFAGPKRRATKSVDSMDQKPETPPMPRLFLALLLMTLAFSGCHTLNRRDRNFVQRFDLSPPLHEKMMHHEPLTLDDIIELSRKGAPPPFIIHYLQPTYYVYKLSSSDVAQLQHSGVNDEVIRYLYATPSMFSPSRQPVWTEDFPQHNSDPYWGYRRY